jgi:hypothetical protein
VRCGTCCAPRSRRRAGARSRSWRRSARTARSAPRASRRAARWTRCWRSPGSRGAGRCCCTTTRAACSTRRVPTSMSRRACTMPASGSGSWTTTSPALRGGRGAAGARSRAARPRRGGGAARPRRSGGARARRVRGPAEPARHGGVHRGRVQRRRHRAARGRDRRRQVVRLPGARVRMGRPQRRAHGGQHQHHQPPGAARRQGPADPHGGAGAGRPPADLRAAEGVAQLPVPRAARAGALGAGVAVRERAHGRARYPGSVGGPLGRRQPRRPGRGAGARGVGRRGRRVGLVHALKCPHFDRCSSRRRPPRRRTWWS